MSKKRFFIFTVFLILSYIFSFMLFVPAVKVFLISIVELLLHRPIRHELWMMKIPFYGKFIIGVLIMLTFCLFVSYKKNIKSKLNLPDKIEIKNNIKDYFNENFTKNNLIKLLIIFLIYSLALFAIIRANIKYGDDLGRTIEGYRGWTNLSRYLSDFLSIFIHGGVRISNISPLPQIIAILILSVASFNAIILLSNDHKVTIFRILASIPIGVSPYFLQCLSYEFDAPYMALAILFSIIPLLFYNKSLSVFFIVSFICNILVCMSYQSALGIYPMLVILFLYRSWKGKSVKENKIIKVCVCAVISYFASIVYFKLFFMYPYEGYVTLGLPAIKEIIPNFFRNLGHYYYLIIHDFNIFWLLVVSVIIITFIVKSVSSSNRNKIVSVLAIFCVILLMGCIMFGVYPVLKVTLFEPRAMLGFGVFISFLLLSSLSESAYKNVFVKINTVIIFWLFFTFTFVYSNALSEQQHYIDFRIQQVITDLNDLEEFNNSENKNVKIVGSIGVAPALKNNSHKSYPILNRLNFFTFGDQSYWDPFYFFKYFNLKNITEATDNEELKIEDLNLTIDTMYHSIYSDGTNFIIKLK